MKCYFRLDKEWIKGFITSFHGDSMIGFSADISKGSPRLEYSITNTEVLFHGNQMSVSGYMEQPGMLDSVGNKVYRLASFDVVFMKPKNKE